MTIAEDPTIRKGFIVSNPLNKIRLENGGDSRRLQSGGNRRAILQEFHPVIVDALSHIEFVLPDKRRSEARVIAVMMYPPKPYYETTDIGV
jgi:hypothetical protein